MLLFLILSLFQEYYYVDGTEFTMTDGKVIKTIETISEDKLNYTWREGAEFIVLPKQLVKSVNYFVFRVPGRKPTKKYENIHERRISGASIIYQKGVVQLLRFRHVNMVGKSIEGNIYYNRIKELKILKSEPEAEKGSLLQFTMDMVDPNTITEIHFFNFRGKKVHSINFDITKLTKVKKWRKKKDLVVPFYIHPLIDLEKIGLVEISSTQKETQ